jgi:uncharacterized protein YgiM (DUF1202 family)
MCQNDTVNDTYVSETHDETEGIKIGLVANCKKLNVREKPTVEAPVVCEIVCQTEVMIDEKESTEEFYKVYTAAGIEGFCMKKFIAIQS